MRGITLSSLILVALTLALPSAAQAQQPGHAGLWRCEQANYTVRNLPADNFTISWIMELRPDGSLVAEGSFYGAVTGYSEPIQGQGRWSATGQGMNLDFKWYLAGNEIPSQIELRAAGPQMVKNGQGQAGRYSISCQRAQE